MGEIFYDTANIKILLITKFYNEIIICDICDVLTRMQVLEITRVGNTDIQVKLNDDIVEKIEFQNSSFLYNVFNSVLYEVFDLHKTELISVLSEKYHDPEIMFHKLKQYINMVYTITLESKNIITLHL